MEPADLGPMSTAAGPDNLVVAFSHPLCTECHELEARLKAERRPFVRIDVRERPDLARKYGIALVPTLVEITPSGAVVRPATVSAG
jgi:thioredoxin-like negative regulator of GroEL